MINKLQCIAKSIVTFIKMKLVIIIFIAFYFFPYCNGYASSFVYSHDNNVIGSIKFHKTEKNDSLIEIARQYKLGYNEITDANPNIEPFLTGPDKNVILPLIWVIPEAQVYDGIIINLPEMRLYYFQKKDGKNIVTTFPIGIGDEGTDTPLGNYKVTQKTVRPSWYPPDSIRKERPELPAVVPPGPNNPLGSHSMRLSGGSYLIHGTNRPWAVGRKVTHGCIRLYPEDIPVLFEMVPIGTKVSIIRQPVKIGKKSDRIFVEVHKNDNNQNINYYDEAITLLIKKNLLNKVNTIKLYEAIRIKSGIPTDITEIKAEDITSPALIADDFI